MKSYGLFVVVVVAAVSLFGGILPALVSAKSTEAVLLAGVIILAIPAVVIALKSMKKGEAK